MNLNFPYLEVVVEPHKNGFKATSPMFPSCKGIGETQEIATSKLSRSISASVAKKFRESIDRTLKTSSCTEVLTDPFVKKDERRLLFGLPLPSDSAQNICIKLPAISELKAAPRKKDAPRDISEIESLLYASGLFEEEDIALTNDMIPEELIFGFPMSYN